MQTHIYYLYNVPNDGHINISETTHPESTIINVNLNNNRCKLKSKKSIILLIRKYCPKYVTHKIPFDAPHKCRSTDRLYNLTNSPLVIRLI